MPKPAAVVLWPVEKDYPRFVAVSTDTPLATYAEFVVSAEKQVAAFEAKGFEVFVLHPDPDAMAEWCLAIRGRVDANDRAAYGGVLFLEQPDENGDVH